MQKFKLKQYLYEYDWKIRTKLITFFVLLFLILADQLGKLWVKKNLELNVEYNLLPGFINLKYIINYGSAFGLNQNKTTMLIIFAFFVTFGLFIWWIFSKSITNIIGLTFFMAGTIGNLIDRFLENGGVIDFLKWDLFAPKTIFNFADIFITIGIITIIIHLIVEGIAGIFNKQKETKENQHGK